MTFPAQRNATGLALSVRSFFFLFNILYYFYYVDFVLTSVCIAN